MPHADTSKDDVQNGVLTPKFIDWLLYELPALREMVEEINPETPGDITLFIHHGRRGWWKKSGRSYSGQTGHPFPDSRPYRSGDQVAATRP